MPKPEAGARMPVELYPLIWSYIATTASGSDLQAPIYGGFIGLLPCTLVCVYWANCVRAILFGGRGIIIRTYGDFMSILIYQGSARLTPLNKMIESVFLEGLTLEDTTTSKEWTYSRLTHLASAYATLPSGRFHLELSLIGPDTKRLMPSHVCNAISPMPWMWTTPRSIPCSPLLFHIVWLRDMRLPNLARIITLLRHFPTVHRFMILRVSWLSSRANADIRPAVRYVPSLNEWQGKSLVLASECTDNVLLAIHALSHTDSLSASLFRNLEEQEWTTYLSLLREMVRMRGEFADLVLFRYSYRMCLVFLYFFIKHSFSQHTAGPSTIYQCAMAQRST